MKKLIALLSILFLALSCGKTDDQKIDEVVLTAQNHLSKRECDDAITALENFGRKDKDARYLQTLASAYACRSGFDEPTFYGTNLKKIGANATSIIGSLTTFTTSPILASSDTSMVDLQKAIDVLLYAGGVASPSSANRAVHFSSDDMSDMNSQLIYMILTQMGKYFFLYGNADPTAGVKGAGTPLNGNDNGNINTCLYTYADPTAIGLISAGQTGSCKNTANVGHPRLTTVSNSLKVARMCQGIVLFNNFVDVLVNTVVAVSGENLQTVGSTLTTAIDSVCQANPILGGSLPAGVLGLCSIKNQADCESTYQSDVASLEIYFAAVFEYLFQ